MNNNLKKNIYVMCWSHLKLQPFFKLQKKKENYVKNNK